MLAGACRERGHEVRVLAGQEPLARRLFVDHVDELWGLSPKESDGRVKTFVDGIAKPLDRDRFVDNLHRLYWRVYVEKTARSFVTEPDDIYSLGRCLTQALEAYGSRAYMRPGQPLRLVEAYVREILSYDPDVVGFSLLERSPPLTRAIVARLRAVSEVPVIAGGAATPHLSTDECDGLLQSSQFDRLLVGPADHTLPDLLDRMAAGARLGDLPNSIYRDGDGVRSTEIVSASDLDGLPFPDFSQIDLDLLPTPVRVLPVQSGRGCSWRKCAFCHWTQQYFGQYYQPFSIERLVDTIAHLRDTYDTTLFTLQDTELPASRARKIATALIDRFGERGVSIAIYFNRLTKGYDNTKLLTLMRRAGFVAVQWGLESGCERVLASMHKGTNVATGGSILEKSHAAGISNHVSILFGFPGETKDEAQETIDHLSAHRQAIDGLGVMSSFYFQADSLIGEHPEEWGGVIDESGEVTWSPGSITGATADAFLHAVMTKVELGALQITSAPVATHHQLHANFIQCAAMYAHGYLRSAEAEAALAGDGVAELVPMFAGVVAERNGSAVWVARHLNENSWVASLHAPHKRVLDNVTHAIVTLGDGTRTIGQIAAELEGEGHPVASTPGAVVDLVREAARDSWVLVFERAWPAAKQPSTLVRVKP
jgi:radical SAM superfamily enzyme YgiQ (UPF0313 family)